MSWRGIRLVGLQALCQAVELWGWNVLVVGRVRAEWLPAAHRGAEFVSSLLGLLWLVLVLVGVV